MKDEQLQNLRYKLQKRVRRLNSTGYALFHFSLRRFMGFLKSEHSLLGILEDLERRQQSLDASAETIVNDKKTPVYDEEEENAALAWFVIKKCAQSESHSIEYDIAHTWCSEGRHDDALEHFKSNFIEPVYEYLDEHLDDQRAMLALLRRYKHKCERYQRDFLYNLWLNNKSSGELHLADHLYEYLYDQGLEFFIEPRSESGRADLVTPIGSNEPLVADAKIFSPDDSKGATYIARGFNQLYIYAQNHDQPFGYLVIFNASNQDMKFSLINQSQLTPFLIHNNKTIFILTIDIFPHETTASARGTLRPLEITEADLIRSIVENPEQASA